MSGYRVIVKTGLDGYTRTGKFIIIRKTHTQTPGFFTCMTMISNRISNRWRIGTFFLITIALFAASACSESGMQSVSCDPSAVAASELTSVDPKIDYNAYNSTFLDPDVARLYGIDRSESLGVVMVSVYRADGPGIGVEACVSGESTNMVGQLKQLDFEEIREGTAIYHISTFIFSDKENLTFNVNVQIAATGKTHELTWGRQFWRG